MVPAVAAQGQSSGAGCGGGIRLSRADGDHRPREKSHSCYSTWSRQKIAKPEVTSSARRCKSSGTLFFSYIGDEDETLRTDLTAGPAPVGQDIRPPHADVFRLHRKRVKSDERIWIMREKFCCQDNEDSPVFSPMRSPLPTPPPPPLPPPHGFSTSLNRKKISCKSVSISVVGLMSEPGSGYDNFESNNHHNINKEDHDCIKVLEKPLLPPPLTFSSQDLAATKSNSSKKLLIPADSLDNEESGSNNTPGAAARKGRCRRYQKPLAVSLFAVGFVLVMTLSVLYWNYYETVTRRSTKKQSIILDHWGKGSSSSATNVDPDSEYLLEKMDPSKDRRTKVSNNDDDEHMTDIIQKSSVKKREEDN